MGLDGIEALYEPFTAANSERAPASWRSGTACWSAPGRTSTAPTAWAAACPASTCPRDDWQRFRAALFAGHALRRPTRAPQVPRRTAPAASPGRARRAASGAARSCCASSCPTLAPWLLFLAAIWGLILPSFERTLLERKREMIRELTNSAWSILAAYQRDEQRAG